MMKTLTALLIVLLASAHTPPATKIDQKLVWLDFNSGMAKARKENKVALIDAYTDWCGWCKVMDKNTFSNAEIIQMINEDFIPIKFNPEKPGNYVIGADTLNGRQLLGAISGGKHGGYPTIYFYLPEKNTMMQQAGYQSPEQFKVVLTNILAQR
jgi:uncharacterized protein YyaL (SSP411 family)